MHAFRFEEFLRYIYDEITYRIIKAVEDGIITKITSASSPFAKAVAFDTSAVNTILKAMGETKSNNLVIALNRKTWSAVMGAQLTANYSYDPFFGMRQIITDSVADNKAIIGDFENGFLVNLPEGEDVKLKFDDLTLATSDLIRVIGRLYVAMDIVNTMMGNPIVLLDIFHHEDASKVTHKAFTNYRKDKELRQNVRNDIAKLEASYLQYLSDYAPIYHKYMKEYDAFCVEKDKKVPLNPIEGGKGAPMQLPRKVEDKSVSESLPSGRSEGVFSTLDTYIAQHPDKTAPAMLLRGVLYQRMGNAEQALSCLHQASVEYPRQADQLSDMFDSYCMRNYLNKTSEGLYLLQLYRSMMEGNGLFSPNLMKAKYYADNGRQEESRNEIYNHFFRRGNQKYYDGLLSDMQFCEKNLPVGFKQLLIDRKFLDVKVEPDPQWLILTDDDEMQVTVRNKSGKRLENVRLFLCIHFTDMYKDEYHVVKVPQTMSIIEPNEEIKVTDVPLGFRDKTYGDITRIRAIAMTDDRLCWVDDIGFSLD